MVLIRGEAGIGKTTLVEAFTSGRRRRVLWGMCDPIVPPRPLAPVVDIAPKTKVRAEDTLEVRLIKGDP